MNANTVCARCLRHCTGNQKRLIHMARKKKNMMSGIINILVMLMIIPIISSAMSGIAGDDPAVGALVAILPVMLIFNAIGDFF